MLLFESILQEAMDAIESIQEEIVLMQLDLKQAFITCTDTLAYDGCQGCIFCNKGMINMLTFTTLLANYNFSKLVIYTCILFLQENRS